MSFDFNQLQQTLNQLIFNQRNLIDRWRKFLLDPAGDVPFEYFDENGNLRTVQVWNRQKLVENLIANANSVMSKIVYVNQISGSDANDGTSSAPFATLQKAVNSVPEGGRVIVNLQSNYTMSPGEVINIANKYVDLRLNGYTITADTYTTSSENSVNRFELNRSYLLIRIDTSGGKIVINNTLDITPAGYLGFIVMRNMSAFALSHYSGMVHPYPTIEVADKVNLIQCFTPARIQIRTTSSDATIKFKGPQAKFMAIDNSPVMLGLGRYPSSGVFFKDENGAVVQPEDLVATGRISGLVRDATTGLPLNVICNYKL